MLNVAFVPRKEHCPDFFLALGPAGLKVGASEYSWCYLSVIEQPAVQQSLATFLPNMLSNVISR